MLGPRGNSRLADSFSKRTYQQSIDELTQWIEEEKLLNAEHEDGQRREEYEDKANDFIRGDRDGWESDLAHVYCSVKNFSVTNKAYRENRVPLHGVSYETGDSIVVREFHHHPSPVDTAPPTPGLQGQSEDEDEERPIPPSCSYLQPIKPTLDAIIGPATTSAPEPDVDSMLHSRHGAGGGQYAPNSTPARPQPVGKPQVVKVKMEAGQEGEGQSETASTASMAAKVTSLQLKVPEA